MPRGMPPDAAPDTFRLHRQHLPLADGGRRGARPGEKHGHGGGCSSSIRPATHGYHVGDTPDPRTVAAARQRGYDLAHLRARRVTDFDFIRFDHVLAMGRDHLEWLQRACPPLYHDKLALLLEFSESFDEDEVPDPYYGGMDGFERVLDLVEDAVEQLLLRLKQR
jgi:protein-tyrosine phosphatase